MNLGNNNKELLRILSPWTKDVNGISWKCFASILRNSIFTGKLFLWEKIPADFHLIVQVSVD